MTTYNLKTEIHNSLVTELEANAEHYNVMLTTIQESKNDDTKSSAGDKFETGREMMQVELDKTEMQLNKLNYALELLNQIKGIPPKLRVEVGSLVICNTGGYYISIGHGKVVVDGEKYYAISMASPIGQLLSQGAVGDAFEFNNRKIIIKEVQ